LREIHPYATDSSERDQWAIYIAIVSIVIGYLLHALVEAQWSRIPTWLSSWLWWIEIPGPIGLYLILRKWMDDKGWSFGLLHKSHLVRIPNLNGKWTGKLKSSHDDMSVEYDCNIVIRQSWTRIAIVLTTNTSRSVNLVAGILVNGVDDALLVYEFRNEPSADAPGTMEVHHGHATLRLEQRDDQELLVGEYYSGRGRRNTGTLSLVRQRPQKWG
jgi:hypothetical protein